MKNLCVLLTLCFLALMPRIVSADAEPFIARCLTESVVAAESNELSAFVSKLSAELRSSVAIAGSFRQRSFLPELDFVEEASGSLHIAYPDRVRWEYLLPEEQTFFLRGAQYEFVQPAQRQILRGTIDEASLAQVALSMLLDPEQGLDDRVNLAVAHCEQEGNSLIEIRDLVEGGVIVLAFRTLTSPGASGMAPQGFTSIESSGSWTSVLFADVQSTPESALPAFEPESSLGYDLIDDRG